jgi:hypothetical protein
VERVVEFLKTNWDRFDDGALNQANRILDGLIETGTRNARRELAAMPEGPRRRTVTRLVASQDGFHHLSHDAIAVLSAKSQHHVGVVAECAEAFHLALQTALDFLFDVRQAKVAGARNLVLAGLLHGAVDELLVAFHLSERAFVPQANAHARTVEETLEVVDLLAADDDLLEAWMDGDKPEREKAVFRKMRKAAAAKSTQAEQRIHSFLSSLGPHAQFRGLQAKTTLAGTTATFFFVGSSKFIESANVLVVRAAVALAHRVATHFKSALDADDAAKRLARCDVVLSKLIRECALPVAAQMQIEQKDLATILAVRLAR